MLQVNSSMDRSYDLEMLPEIQVDYDFPTSPSVLNLKYSNHNPHMSRAPVSQLVNIFEPKKASPPKEKLIVAVGIREKSELVNSFVENKSYLVDDDEMVPSMEDLAAGPCKTFNAFELTPGLRNSHFV